MTYYLHEILLSGLPDNVSLCPFLRVFHDGFLMWSHLMYGRYCQQVSLDYVSLEGRQIYTAVYFTQTLCERGFLDLGNGCFSCIPKGFRNCFWKHSWVPEKNTNNNSFLSDLLHYPFIGNLHCVLHDKHLLILICLVSCEEWHSDPHRALG